MTNFKMIIDNMTTILMIMCAICVLISVITEFTKEIKPFKKIPTKLQVLVLSIVICMLLFFTFISYMNIKFMWYYLVAVILISFIIAIITANGWDYFIDIIKRFYRRNIDLNADEDTHE